MANGDEVLRRIDEDQPIARSVTRRFCDQPAVFGERAIDVLQQEYAGGQHDAGQGRKTLGRDLVERKVRGGRARPRKGNAAKLAHRLQFAVFRAAAMKAEHQQAALGLCPVERLLKRHAGTGGDELVLERSSMAEQRFERTLMDIVTYIPEPEIGLRQSA